jgi:CheY-like chemotaxis protein
VTAFALALSAESLGVSGQEAKARPLPPGVGACDFGALANDHTREGLNIRAEPRADSAILGRLLVIENGYHEKIAADVHVIGVKNGWFLIEDAGYERLLTGVRGLRRSLDNMSVSKPAILVVEDEFLLREAAVALVEDAGFEALAAVSADEAIAILETRAEEVRLVFTDIQIAGPMDGLKLAHAVRDRWPPVELILTSGRRHIQPDDLPDRGQFFAKPYDFNAVLQAFQEMARG